MPTPRWIVPSLALVACAAAEEAAPTPAAAPVVVSATRLDQDAFVQPYALYQHDRADLDQTAARTLTDKLDRTPGVYVQRTAPNQASPYIRGLTGEQTLLLFDGVRLNHAMNRPGPNQYAAMLPDESIGRIDAILGSGSAVVGSDGLTGALDFRLAEAGRGVDRAFSPFVTARGSSAEGYSVGGGIDGTAGGWAWSADGGFAQYHELQGGKDAGDHLSGSSAGHSDIPNTGYDQYSYGARVAYLGLERNRFELAAGQSVQLASPRPDGYFANSGVSSRISRFYDPQRFTYAHLRHVWDAAGAVDKVQTTLWYHQHDEEQEREDISGGRYRRRINEDSIATIGGDLQLTSRIATHEVTYGGTAYQDRTDTTFTRYRSPAAVTDPAQQVLDQTTADAPGSTTVPDDATYDGLAVFLQDSWWITPQWNLLGGVRWSRSAWDYRVTDDRAGYAAIVPGAGAGAALDIDGSEDAITGNARLGFLPIPELFVFAGVGQGFRAPNLSNLAGIQDRGSSSSGGTGPQVEGNPDLEAETSLTYELGGRWQHDADHIALTGFATLLQDLIQVVYIDVDLDGDIDANDRARSVNAEDGLLLGFEFASDYGLPIGLPEGWRLAVVQATSYVSGEADVPQPQAGGVTREEHISRANLFFGKAGLKLSLPGRFWAMPQVRWSDRYDEIAPGDASDTRHTTFRAKGDPAGAMPGYAVLDLLAGWSLPEERLSITTAIENTADKTYRNVGSGADGAGMSAVLTVAARF